MDVYLGRLDGVVSEIFLNNPQIMRAFVEFTCITVSDLMRRDPFRRIEAEDVLYRSGGNTASVSPFEDGTGLFSVQMLPDLTQGVCIAEHDPDLSSFSSDADCLFLKIYIFGADPADLGDTHPCSIDSPNEQSVPGICQ